VQVHERHRSGERRDRVGHPELDICAPGGAERIDGRMNADRRSFVTVSDNLAMVSPFS
jgi:hypothetical protein